MSDPDDLEFEPIRSDPRKTIAAVLALGLVGFVAYKINARIDAERKDRELQRAADAWASLQRCLVGDQARPGEIAAQARRIELRVPANVRQLPPPRRRREWPYRCATYASKMTHALFESRSDDPRHRMLNQFASQAATDLENGALHTSAADPRRYLDELFAAADRAGLPRGRAESVPPPPTPMTVLRAQQHVGAFAGAGAAALVAEEPVALGDAAHVVLGRSERRHCQFAHGLAQVECRRASALDGATALRITSSRGGSPGVIRADAWGVGPLRPLNEARSAPFHDRVTGAFHDDADAWLVLTAPSQGAGTRYDLLNKDLASAALPALPARPVVAPWMFSTLFVALVPASATADAGVADAGVGDGGGASGRDVHIYAGNVQSVAAPPWTWTSAITDRGSAGSVPDAPVVRACEYGPPQGGDAPLAAVVYADDGHASVLWRTTPTTVTLTRADARPGHVTCGNGQVRMAWYTAQPYPTFHVTTCTPAGCTHAEGSAPEFDVPPAVVALGDRVLAVYTRAENQGLRYRMGALAQILDAPEVVLFDSATQGGAQFEAPPALIARGDAVVALVNRKGAPHEVYMVRIDAQGHRALTARTSP